MARRHRDVLRVLIADIVGGVREEGEQLPRETDLVEEFGVSRGVVRECIRALEERHLVSVKHGKGAKTDGWADETFLVKYRILSANEENGNYILTAFMGFSAPTGDDGNSNHHGVFTPTIAGGKGFGAFDIQSTAGIALPDGGLQRLGMPVAWNTALQYRVFHYFWPEFEVNYTWWPNGEREGETQVFLTPGILVGRIPIHERVGVTVGFGYQVAVTKNPMYNHSAILSGRIPF